MVVLSSILDNGQVRSSHHALKPSKQIQLREAASTANHKAKATQNSDVLKKKYKYISNDGSEYDPDPENPAQQQVTTAVIVSEDEAFIEETSGSPESNSDFSEDSIDSYEVYFLCCLSTIIYFHLFYSSQISFLARLSQEL